MMKNYVDVLSQYGFPSSGLLRGLQQMKEIEGNLEARQYEKKIAEITDITRHYDDVDHARLSYMYLIQNLATLMINGSAIPESEMFSILSKSEHQATQFIQDTGWAFSKKEEYETDNETGVLVVKERKVSKQKLAIDLVKENPTMSTKELVELFVANLNMSVAGARTYVHNIKKGIWKTT